ncbi:hypothetical protein AArcSl_1281 [Halalkaliarchaeum desulfuricum]|uniref:Uncharacterized protein n=1 Tax=Halalkaliarchaeum desulfuricum TaxID=2055893 RepID=A0A343TIJ0_9EURY|nr:hypothetical protein [Halalkaliarchaeum desulfuricum]AUX08912.1 hypothetical protein AArcSl_1281 [Halalkaliarchaeum desulfuricum]
MNRSDQIEFIRKHLLPLVDTEFKISSDNKPDDEFVEEAEILLAETYLDKGRGTVWWFLKVIVPLAVLDVLFQMSPQVYGLVISMVGTWFLLVESDIMGRFTIAGQATYTSGAIFGGGTHLDRDEAKRLAENTVATNIALVWLTAGFMFQILAVQLFGDTSVISTNLLSGASSVI